MEESKRKLIKGRLNREKEKIVKTMEKMKNKGEHRFANEFSTELSFYDNHPADLGTETFFMEQDRGLINELKNTIFEIDESISDLDSNKYGICKECGKCIDDERLDIIPYLKTCADCAKTKNITNRDIKSDMKEENKSYYRRDGKQKNMFDREDSYQMVARHNRISKDPSFGTGDDMGVFDDQNSGVVEKIERIED